MKPGLTSAEREIVDQLAADFCDRRLAGENPSEQEYLQRLLSSFSERCAKELEEEFLFLIAIDALLHANEDSKAGRTRVASPPVKM